MSFLDFGKELDYMQIGGLKDLPRSALTWPHRHFVSYGHTYACSCVMSDGYNPLEND